jgi:hypothetical protein
MCTQTQVRAAKSARADDALVLIEYLIKESEVMTGEPGRVFEIIGAERLKYRVYRVFWQSHVFKVERLDDGGHPLDTRYLLPKEFARHSLVEALASGQLYTRSVCAPR